MTKQENARAHYNQSSGVLNRRKGALARLQNQLKTGKKPLESARLQAGERVMDDLSDKDITRIKKEISVLTSKI